MHPRIAWQQATAIAPVLNVGCESDPAQLGQLPGSVNLDIDRWRGHPRFVQADAVALPFKDRSFATVALCECLDHIERPVEAIKEAARVASRMVIATLPADDGGCEPPDHWRVHLEHLKGLGLAAVGPGSNLAKRHGHKDHWLRTDVEQLFAAVNAHFELTGPHGFSPPEWHIVMEMDR